MPEQIRCPECDATLRVPDNLLGQNVKCPKCQAMFLAELEGLAETEKTATQTEGIVREPRRPAEEEHNRYWQDDDRLHRLRRRDTVGARSDVAGPATALIVVAGIDLFLGVVRFVAPLLGLGLTLIDAGGEAKVGDDADFAVAVGANIFLGLLHFAFGGLILAGGIKMKRMQSLGLAKTACVLAMIPCFNCCLLGLPFGIWGLNVLSRPEVQAAFRQYPSDTLDEMP